MRFADPSRTGERRGSFPNERLARRRGFNATNRFRAMGTLGNWSGTPAPVPRTLHVSSRPGRLRASRFGSPPSVVDPPRSRTLAGRRCFGRESVRSGEGASVGRDPQESRALFWAGLLTSRTGSALDGHPRRRPFRPLGRSERGGGLPNPVSVVYNDRRAGRNDDRAQAVDLPSSSAAIDRALVRSCASRHLSRRMRRFGGERPQRSGATGVVRAGRFSTNADADTTRDGAARPRAAFRKREERVLGSTHILLGCVPSLLHARRSASRLLVG